MPNCLLNLYLSKSKAELSLRFFHPCMKAFLLLILLGGFLPVQAQIPVELFAGHEKTTLDVMFFRFFNHKKNAPEKKPQRWLFFNRNRVAIDYRMTTKTYLPQFGFTEALSYNHEKLKGFAPVVIGQAFSWGVSPKAGIQYALIKKELTLFSWLVCETLNRPDLDFFLLLRYTPKLSKKLNLFTQAESVNAFSTEVNGPLNFTQRMRLGLQIHRYQFGVGADFNQTVRQNRMYLYNAGGFFRHEF